uniref:Uncharacterized protein n=1 Tax=Anopheles dirus TaxID=7168 RepID=A0A182MZ97_9DIPT
MESYTTAVLRLCVLTEINNATENVFTLAEYLANDLRLLSKMKLSDESNAIFYRLYKNALHAVVKCCLEEPSKERTGVKFDEYGKRIQAFMSVLVEQLDANDCEFAVSRHVANALCNMLVLTQEVDSRERLLIPLRYMTFRVQPEMLQKLAAYIERQVFVEHALPDEGQNYLLARKLMLATYGDVYRLHHALPRKTDLCHILKHVGTNTAFTEELEQLLNTVHANDPNEFYGISAQVAMNFCTKSSFTTKVKTLWTNLHKFRTQCLQNVDEDKYSYCVIRNIIDLLLEQPYACVGLEKLFAIMKPWVMRLSSESRSEL